MLEIQQLYPSRPASHQPAGRELVWCALVYKGQRLCSFECDTTTDLADLLSIASASYRDQSRRNACRQLDDVLSSPNA